jgi:hypothetical protein
MKREIKLSGIAKNFSRTKDIRLRLWLLDYSGYSIGATATGVSSFDF